MSSNGHHHFVPTDEQRQAIEHVHGPMLVVAGAGTGKTTVLARRIAHLIQSEAAKPDEILAVTYTRNSAAELIQPRRRHSLSGRGQQSLYPEMDRPGPRASCFAAACRRTRFIRIAIGCCTMRATSSSLLDDKDLFVLLRRRVAELKLQHYIKAADAGKISRRPAEVFQQLSRRAAHA